MYEELGQGERDRLLQEAVGILRARGWRRPELAGEDLERMMQELLLQRSFGPERLRKYRERLAASEERNGTGGGARCRGGSSILCRTGPHAGESGSGEWAGRARHSRGVRIARPRLKRDVKR